MKYITYERVIWALILIIIVLAVYWWYDIISNTPIPQGSIDEPIRKRRHKLSPSPMDPGPDFYFFPKLGVINTSTTLRDQEGPLFPNELAKRCRMFGKNCMGFDSDGHLILTRDKTNLRFRQYEDKTAGYYRHLPEGDDEFKIKQKINVGN